MENIIDNQQAKHEICFIKWISCLIESEGSIGFQTYNFNPKENRVDRLTPQITITNSDLGLLEEAVRILKEIVQTGSYIADITKREKNKGFSKKPLYAVRILGIKRVNKILLVIYPHLIGEKKIKAKAVLDFMEKALANWQKRKEVFPNWYKNKIKNHHFNTRIGMTDKERIIYLKKCRESSRDYTPKLKYIKIQQDIVQTLEKSK